MRNHRSTKKQLLLERRRNEALQAQCNQLQANMDYVAMMSDIELEDETALDKSAETETAGGEANE